MNENEIEKEKKYILKNLKTNILKDSNNFFDFKPNHLQLFAKYKNLIYKCFSKKLKEQSIKKLSILTHDCYDFLFTPKYDKILIAQTCYKKTSEKFTEKKKNIFYICCNQKTKKIKKSKVKKKLNFEDANSGSIILQLDGFKIDKFNTNIKLIKDKKNITAITFIKDETKKIMIDKEKISITNCSSIFDNSLYLSIENKNSEYVFDFLIELENRIASNSSQIFLKSIIDKSDLNLFENIIKITICKKFCALYLYINYLTMNSQQCLFQSEKIHVLKKKLKEYMFKILFENQQYELIERLYKLLGLKIPASITKNYLQI
ncbi:hypothetical protein KA977_04040 [Candidatus Dependentiae bacterium]|nr:hypothetical protein [Candidatus Dependentiae bacterium]